MPTYNRAGYLAECLDSIFAQTLAPDEVIVVDDGSTDETSKVLEAYADRIVLVQKPNGGKASALNIGLARASYDAVWICDDDDIADPRALDRLATLLRDQPEVGFSFGLCQNFWCSVDDDKQYVDVSRVEVVLDDLRFQLLEHCFIFQEAMLVRRHCFDQAGPFDETLIRAQDYDMLLRLTAEFKGAFVDEVIFYQRQHGGDRGPQEHRLAGAGLWDKQASFDRIVFQKRWLEDPIESYLPWANRDRHPLSVDRRAWALLRRAAFCMNRRLFQEAAKDLATLSKLSKDQHVDLSSFDIKPLLHKGGRRIADHRNRKSIASLIQAIAGLSDRSISRQVSRALIWPMLRRSLRHLSRGRIRDFGRAGLFLVNSRLIARVL